MKNIVNILLALAFSASVAFADDKMPAGTDSKDATQAATSDAATTDTTKKDETNTTAPVAADSQKDEKK